MLVLSGWFWLFAKVFFVVSLFIWFRASFPRYRYDQIMGFVTLGFFIFNSVGMAGGIVQMISHGFVSGAMFFCIGVMSADRKSTRLNSSH